MMATRIRLRRMGAKKAPFYRIVVADSRYPRDGRFIEEIGYYDPTKHPAAVKIVEDRARYWIGIGAQPSDTVKALMVKAGITVKTAKPGKRPAVDVVADDTAAAPAIEAAAAIGADTVVETDTVVEAGAAVEADAAAEADAVEAQAVDPAEGTADEAADESAGTAADQAE